MKCKSPLEGVTLNYKRVVQMHVMLIVDANNTREQAFICSQDIAISILYISISSNRNNSSCVVLRMKIAFGHENDAVVKSPHGVMNIRMLNGI